LSALHSAFGGEEPSYNLYTYKKYSIIVGALCIAAPYSVRVDVVQCCVWLPTALAYTRVLEAIVE